MKEQHYFLLFFPKICNLNVNMRKYWKSKIEGTMQNNWPAIFKGQGMKTK
jgi:hypothetical protein